MTSATVKHARGVRLRQARETGNVTGPNQSMRS